MDELKLVKTKQFEDKTIDIFQGEEDDFCKEMVQIAYET